GPTAERKERQQPEPLASTGQAECDREQPAHCRVEPVKKPKACERQPRPDLGRDCAHADPRGAGAAASPDVTDSNRNPTSSHRLAAAPGAVGALSANR